MNSILLNLTKTFKINRISLNCLKTSATFIPSTSSAKTDNSNSNKTDLIFSDETRRPSARAENISRAMQYYLEKSAEREAIMKVKTEEFEIGKRHLAKMMGENPDTITQVEIDKAIEYLLPSGLYEPRARPFLRHPEDYYPKSKLAAFNKDGRPIHSLFYTGNSLFYQIIYELTQKFINLKKLEDAMNMVKSKIRIQKIDLKSNNKIDLTGSVWISRQDLAKKLNANVDEFNYSKFIVLIQKMAEHPLSKREEEYIKQFLVPFESPIKLSDIEALKKDEQGRSYQEVISNQRTAIAKVKLYEGTGKINISSPEGKFHINYFQSLRHREQILFPFKVIDQINKYDVDIEVNKGGMTCLSKAIRYGISKALCSFVSTDNIEKLRLAGLLTRDIRMKERKKPGQEGARRKYVWLKR